MCSASGSVVQFSVVPVVQVRVSVVQVYNTSVQRECDWGGAEGKLKPMDLLRMKHARRFSVTSLSWHSICFFYLFTIIFIFISYCS